MLNVLIFNSQLEILDLRLNAIGNKGMKIICDGLKTI